MPKGARSFQFSFDERGITHFGGMWLIQRFCHRIRFRHLLKRHVSIPTREGPFQPTELILALVFCIIMGLRRINKTDILQYNGAFLNLLGLERFPDQSTLRRFLKRLTPKDIRQVARLHDSLRSHLFDQPRSRTSLILDLDSTVLTVYGKQQGAQVGYNPRKRGHRSYHPLLAFEATFQEFWHGSLRPGNTVSGTGAPSFLKICLAKIPRTMPRSRVRFRMDSGFYGNRIIRFLEAERCHFVIVARLFSTIRRRAMGVRFTKLRNGFEVGEFQDRIRQSVPHRCRFVVVRRPIPEDPVEAKQLTLFKDRKFAYHVLATNLPWHPWRVYRFYRGHASVEKNIREFLYDYPLGKIPTDTWTANVAFFQLVVFAANIVHWFKRLCLPAAYLTTTLETIRTDFLVLPARLVRQGRRNVVRLPHDYHYQKAFLAASRKIEVMRLPARFHLCPTKPARTPL